jgi:hypothetical protein
MPSSYKDLLYKPSIEKVLLEGNKTTDSFGFQWTLTAGKQIEIEPLSLEFDKTINAIDVENPVSISDTVRDLSPDDTSLEISYEDQDKPNEAKTHLNLKNSFVLYAEEWTNYLITVKLKTEYDLSGTCTISCDEIDFDLTAADAAKMKEKAEVKNIEYVSGSGTKEDPLKFDIEKFKEDFLKYNDSGEYA